MTIDIFKVPQGEMNILKILWDNPRPMTIHQLSRALEDRFHKTLTPSGINTLATRLVKKGLILYVQTGGRNLYMPLCPREEYQAFASRRFLSVLFHGSVAEMVFPLLLERSISREDWIALKEMADIALAGAEDEWNETAETEESFETTEIKGTPGTSEIEESERTPEAAEEPETIIEANTQVGRKTKKNVKIEEAYEIYLKTCPAKEPKRKKRRRIKCVPRAA